MAQNHNILQELSELNSTLANVNLQEVYEVPAGYFEELTVQVLNRIRALQSDSAADELGHLSPTLLTISKEMPYSIPSDYFNGLEIKMLEHVLQNSSSLQAESIEQSSREELESISPLLAGLKKDMPYTVPQGYFEGIDTARNDNRDTGSGGKVISIASTKWFRYAAAAVVTSIIAVTVLILSADRNTVKSLAEFEKKLNKELKKMSDKELNDFIQYTDTERDVVQNEAKEDVKKLLKDVPVTEMQQFLEEISDPEISADENTFME